MRAENRHNDAFVATTLACEHARGSIENKCGLTSDGNASNRRRVRGRKEVSGERVVAGEIAS